ncbi:cytochrome cd1-nitrite reductase-like C-terminal heme d1 [Penicillium cosmopolitanum]|uniref:Cytochrome cd1-nitrite reductase-like C-terminal heme d1 n=1 Tax=Penicillium cosmopolitanum TaxID=1131564 RepID=A0A9W9SD15_9EURO|nr:cytochrome cd1-nitrite reductase-like C-terminal heme d1 [Penicillium cosmopolitanum]KAJ5375887.1 cytochrome cd1-nitrite reductase-like C-terminal heme d1 [Penicillium cosmopolitanum]
MRAFAALSVFGLFTGVRCLSYEIASTIPWTPKAPSSVDQSTVYNGTYYLADRTNSMVHVVDLSTSQNKPPISGFKGQAYTKNKTDSSISGPDGLIVLPNLNELYVGDGDGSVKVIDLLTGHIVSNISTGSTKRADEFAYDPQTQTVVVTNPNDDPPFVTIISAAKREVSGRILFHNASGLEQPAFNAVNGMFYVSVPSTDTNPGGEIAEINVSSKSISKVIPLSECIPAGIAFGPMQNLFVGCSQDQILDYGMARSQVLDIATGKVIANISGIAGIDQVVYNPTKMLYYASAYQNLAGGNKSGKPNPQLAVIDAANNTLIQTWATDNTTAHSVAVDVQNNLVAVPIQKEGIVVYNLTIASSGTLNATTSAKPTSTAISSGGHSHEPNMYIAGVLAFLYIFQ